MADIQISSEKFYQRLGKLMEGWQANRSTAWSNADSLCILLGTREEDETSYSKASSLHLYLLGYEITDSIIIITKTHFWFMASEKKCKYLETALANQSSTITFQALHKTKDEGMNRENFNKLLGIARKCCNSVGMPLQTDLRGPFMQAWQNSFDQSQLEKVDISLGLALLLAVKDESELVSTVAQSLSFHFYMIYDFLCFYVIYFDLFLSYLPLRMLASARPS